MASAEEPKRTPPDILGVPRSAAVEIVVAIAVMLIVDQVFFGGVRFRDVGPHPFWLLVMVVAAQYGTPAGVFAALLGALVAFLGNLPPRDPLQNRGDSEEVVGNVKIPMLDAFKPCGGAILFDVIGFAGDP